MNSNDITIELKEICKIINSIPDEQELKDFLSEVLTDGELLMLTKRWRILKMLSSGVTQRDIAKELNVSLCNVTRGAKVLKNKESVVTKYLMKGKN